MVKSHVKSWFEIWGYISINYPDSRPENKRDLIILQIEYATQHNYVVEVIKPEDYKLGYFSSKKEV